MQVGSGTVNQGSDQLPYRSFAFEAGASRRVPSGLLQVHLAQARLPLRDSSRMLNSKDPSASSAT
jgi:hypothetical protein